MKLKCIFTFIFSLIMTFSLVACNGGGEETVPETTEMIQESTVEAVDLDLHIVQGGESEYVIVRPESSKDDVIDAMQQLRGMVKDKYGISLRLDTDGKRKPGTEPGERGLR